MDKSEEDSAIEELRRRLGGWVGGGDDTPQDAPACGLAVVDDDRYEEGALPKR